MRSARSRRVDSVRGRGRVQSEADRPGWTSDVAARALDQLIYLVGYSQQRVEEGLRWGEVARQIVERMGGDTELEVTREQQVGPARRGDGAARALAEQARVGAAEAEAEATRLSAEIAGWLAAR